MVKFFCNLCGQEIGESRYVFINYRGKEYRIGVETIKELQNGHRVIDLDFCWDCLAKVWKRPQ